jgi:hypothetical protein
MDFNSTVRKPRNDLFQTDWFTDTKNPIEKSSLQNVDEETDDHHEQRSPSPLIHDRPESNTYDSNDFDENDEIEQ